MSKIFIFCLLVTTVALVYSQEDCKWRWKTYFECVNTENSKYSDKKFLTTNENEQMQTEMQRCFERERCNNGFTWQLRNARRNCYSKYKISLIKYLEKCMYEKTDRPYSLPEAAQDPQSKELFKNWIKRFANDQKLCRADYTAKTRINQCIDAQFTRFMRTNRRFDDECKNKCNVCGRKVDKFCYDEWNLRAKNTLRQCVGEWNVGPREDMRYGYISCVSEATGYKYSNYRLDDPYTKYFEYGNLIQRFVDRREPCPGRLEPY